MKKFTLIIAAVVTVGAFPTLGLCAHRTQNEGIMSDLVEAASHASIRATDPFAIVQSRRRLGPTTPANSTYCPDADKGHIVDKVLPGERRLAPAQSAGQAS
jgi:hypothetical protein